MNEHERTTRRSFIKSVAAVGAAAAAGSTGCSMITGDRRIVQTAPVFAPRRESLRVAFIGTGGRGGAHLQGTRELAIECPCYCDVDSRRMTRAAGLYPDAKAYQDYRKMLDEEIDNIDAVMVATPDHHHYPAAMMAMQRGKHVYCEKPLTHTPWEARQLAEAAQKYQLATQMGNQGHAREGWRLIYEWIHNGDLGHVVETHTWTNRPIWPQGIRRPEGSDPVPSSLDWDIWLGPAPERPFKEEVYHDFNWRGWWDFGAGALGDMACHTMDAVFGALDPGHPTSVEPMAMSRVNQETFPEASMIKWEFPRKGKRRAFTSYWYDGGLKPTLPDELEVGRRIPGTGCIFIGTKASMLVSGDYNNSPRIIPEEKMKDIGRPPQMLERSPGHMEEWVMAASGKEPIDFPKSNFSYAAPFTEAILLGNVALRVGRRIEWDGPSMTVTNLPEANAYINKEYREGWRV